LVHATLWPDGAVFERSVSRLRRNPLVPIVEKVADQPAEKGAADHARRDARPAGPRGTGDEAAHGRAA